MKDKTTRSPLVRISLVFLTVTMLGVTSSWISSCTDSKAAQDTAGTAGNHSDIIARLERIEAKQGDPDSGNGETTADLIKFLALEIGKMAERILVMADKIVETEKLIVSVITNQTAATTGIIGGIKNSDGTLAFPDYANNPQPYVLNQILAGHGTANGVLLTSLPGPPANANRAPLFSFVGMNGPAPIAYVLLISSNGTFDMNSQSQFVDLGNPLNTAWRTMTTNLGINGNGNKVFYAIKTVNGGQLSAASNTLNVVL